MGWYKNGVNTLREHIGALTVRCGADAARHPIVVEMRRRPARIADQEDAIVQAIGVRVGDIGVGAFDSPREIGADEQVEDPINAVGRDAAPFGL